MIKTAPKATASASASRAKKTEAQRERRALKRAGVVKETAKPTKTAALAKAASTKAAKAPAAHATPAQSRNGRSTSDVALEMLQRPDGASAAEIAAVTNWLPHTTRAWISTYTRKNGLKLESAREDGRGRVYKVTA